MHVATKQARYRRLGPWAGFPEGLTSTYMLDPSDPLFTDIGAAFVQACAPFRRPSALLERCKTHVVWCMPASTSANPILSTCTQELRAEYGSDPVGFYATDAFNENVPPSDDPDFLRASSAAVFGVRGQCAVAVQQGLHHRVHPDCARTPVLGRRRQLQLSPHHAVSGRVQAMEAGDPTARWIMQAWLFFNEGFFWKPPQVQVGMRQLCLML